MIEGKNSSSPFSWERRPLNSYIKQIKNDARFKTFEELK